MSKNAFARVIASEQGERGNLFSKDELINQLKFTPRVANCAEIFAAIDKERAARLKKGDFISMGCPQSVYLAHKDEIDKNVKGIYNERTTKHL